MTPVATHDDCLALHQRLRLDHGCAERTERTEEALDELRKVAAACDRLLLQIAGADGRNGKLGLLLDHDHDHEQRIRRLETLAAKTAAISGIAAAIFASVVSWLMGHI